MQGRDQVPGAQGHKDASRLVVFQPRHTVHWVPRGSETASSFKFIPDGSPSTVHPQRFISGRHGGVQGAGFFSLCSRGQGLGQKSWEDWASEEMGEAGARLRLGPDWRHRVHLCSSEKSTANRPKSAKSSMATAHSQTAAAERRRLVWRMTTGRQGQGHTTTGRIWEPTMCPMDGLVWGPSWDMLPLARLA